MGKTLKKASNLVFGRSYVKQYAPYFSPTLYAFVPTPVENLTELVGGPMAVTDRLILLYDPVWLEQEDELVIATGLAHEIMHEQLRHVRRREQYEDKRRFNIAGDLFINGLLEKQMKSVKTSNGTQQVPMWKIPEWAALPSRYGFPDGKTADEYYVLLSAKEKKDKEDKKEKKEDGDCEDQKPGGFMCGTCGSAAGHTKGKELEAKYGEVTGRSPMECHNIAKSTAKLTEAHLKGNARGNMPGQWSNLFDMAEDKYYVPWESKLANVTRQGVQVIRRGGTDYSMRRPSARSYLRGWPLPGLVGYEPEIGFVVDSSGSMGGEQLGTSLRVIANVLNQTGIRSAWFMEADAGVQRAPIRISVNQLRHMRLAGGGGTDFTPAIEYMQKFRPRISLLFYLTDGDGSAPAEAPREFHTVWCVVPSQYNRRPATWGTLVVLSNDQDLRE